MQSFEALGRAIVEEARGWEGTPYMHQQRTRGRGVDCVGLILGVGLALEVMTFSAAAWRPFARYGRLPNPDRFMRGVEAFLAPGAGLLHGSVVVMQWREDMPMHLGIIEETGAGWYLIHAFEHRSRCVRHVLDRDWAKRVHSHWLYPGHAAAR